MSCYFWPNFTPLSHFVTHPGTPPRKYVTHLGPPTIFKRPSTKKPGQKPPCTNSVPIVRGGFVRGFFVWQVLSRVVFVHSRKLNITLNLRPSTKNPDKSPLVQILSQLSAGVLSGGFCQMVFCLAGFVRGGFCPFP